MKNSSFALDKSAIGFSLACTIHCIITPFLIIMIPTLASTSLADEAFHKGLLFFVLPMSILALYKAYLHHRQSSLIAYGTLGLAIIASAGIWGHDVLGEQGEKAATILGSAIVALAHIKNIQLCKKEACHEINKTP